jgi:hypothetical protein
LSEGLAVHWDGVSWSDAPATLSPRSVLGTVVVEGRPGTSGSLPSRPPRDDLSAGYASGRGETAHTDRHCPSSPLMSFCEQSTRRLAVF